MLKHPLLGSALLQLYPQADLFHDFRCEDLGDGNGPRLTHWNTEKLGPEPNLKQIEQAAKDYDRAQGERERLGKMLHSITVEEYMAATFESKLGNEAPMTALLERYKAIK